MLLNVVFGIIRCGYFGLILFLKYFDFVIFNIVKFFLWLFFCYWVFLGGGIDEIMDVNVVYDVKWIGDLIEILI